MAFFEKEFISIVRSATDLVDLMKEYGEQFKAKGSIHGKNATWICSCPGKKETNKSRVNIDQQLYNCYSCLRAGNVFNFIMEVENIGFTDAVEFLAMKANIPLPDSVVKNDEFRQRSKVYEEAMTFYRKFPTLYFKKRGMDPDDVVKSRAGFAPGNMFLKNDLIAKGYSEEYLKKCGLVNDLGMDALFQRVVFPIYFKGLIVDLYGRRTDEREDYKHFYLNGVNICYGIDDVKPEQPVVIVESIFNAETLKKVFAENKELFSQYFKNGISVIATGGCTKFSEYHINLLKKKNVPLVFICYDADRSGAGQEEALKTGKMLVHRKIKTKIIEMPVQVDVNQFFVNEHQTANAFIQLMLDSHMVDTYEYLLNLRKMPRELIESYLTGTLI